MEANSSAGFVVAALGRVADAHKVLLGRLDELEQNACAEFSQAVDAHIAQLQTWKQAAMRMSAVRVEAAKKSLRAQIAGLDFRAIQAGWLQRMRECMPDAGGIDDGAATDLRNLQELIDPRAVSETIRATNVPVFVGLPPPCFRDQPADGPNPWLPVACMCKPHEWTVTGPGMSAYLEMDVPGACRQNVIYLTAGNTCAEFGDPVHFLRPEDVGTEIVGATVLNITKDSRRKRFALTFAPDDTRVDGRVVIAQITVLGLPLMTSAALPRMLVQPHPVPRQTWLGRQPSDLDTFAWKAERVASLSVPTRTDEACLIPTACKLSHDCASVYVAFHGGQTRHVDADTGLEVSPRFQVDYPESLYATPDGVLFFSPAPSPRIVEYCPKTQDVNRTFAFAAGGDASAVVANAWNGTLVAAACAPNELTGRHSICVWEYDTEDVRANSAIEPPVDSEHFRVSAMEFIDDDRLCLCTRMQSFVFKIAHGAVHRVWMVWVGANFAEARAVALIGTTMFGVSRHRVYQPVADTGTRYIAHNCVCAGELTDLCFRINVRHDKLAAVMKTFLPPGAATDIRIMIFKLHTLADAAPAAAAAREE